VPDASHHDDLATLARTIRERVAPLCSDVPAHQLESLTSRLAWLQVAGNAPDDEGAPESVAPVAANQVVWLPGSPGAAIVWPTGDEPARRLPTLAELKAHAHRHAETARALQARGLTSLRHARAALLDAYQARTRAELSDR